MDGFWVALGRLWNGFGKVGGRIWKDLKAFWIDNGQILEMLGIIWPCCGQASKLDPRADPRSVTIRGGSVPLRVLDEVTSS